MKKLHFIPLLSILLLTVFITHDLLGQRTHGGYYTAEKINNLRNNSNKYPWAKKLKNEAIERASYWVNIPDEELWAMVPGQDLPRCIDVTMDRLAKGPKTLGCLKCGDNIKSFGNYPYEPDFKNKPWKLTCPSCNVVFPTNDFEKFYRSAIDERGLFDPSKGDRSLLYNEDHPDPSDPLHKYGVDDGFGYIDENGRGHRFIGYYTWKYWMHLNNGLAALADAYLYTGEKQYAHKAAILLDRIADVYPDMDWKPYADMGWYHSDGGRNMGKIEGSIWETGVVQKFADSYDKILSGTVDSPELFDFLERQSEKYQLPSPKGSRDLFVRNVDDRILKTAFEAVLSQQIRGNQGMHQLTVAMCAIALNTEPQTSRWLDWLFEPDGGSIPGLMVNLLDRDGTSDEGAPGYAMIWGHQVTKIASWISEYTSYTRNDIFKDFPQFRATFLAAYRMAVLGKAIPNMGDTGTTGLVTNALANPHFMVQGYKYIRDPEIAIAAYRANGNSAEGLGRNIFNSNPDALSEEIQRIAEKAGPRPEGGYLMSGFGLAILESGAGDSGFAIVSNYGRTKMHAHPDLLNFDLFAYGNWLAPDHGYPEFASPIPSNREWTGSTISHNTVYVNEHPQKEIWGGHTRMFKQLKGFGIFEIDGNKAYPEIDKYSRTMLLIGVQDAITSDSNAYVVDIFRVKGGEDHVYSFHGPPGEMKIEGLELEAQTKGTYAGEDIPKGIWSDNFPIGYAHLYNVRRDNNPSSRFMADWKVQPGYRSITEADDIHLRFHALSPSDDVALADGDPPQNKAGNPKSLDYVLMHRAGEQLNSTFVSVIEPYKSEPFIKSIRRLDDGKEDRVALKIERTDGTNDYVLYNTSSQKVMRVDGISLKGTAGFIRESKGNVEKGILVNGTELKYRKLKLKSSGIITGKVVKMNREMTGGGWFLVDTKLPVDGSLKGHQIIIENENERDATYTIQDVQREGDLTRVYCGPITFVRGFRGGEMVVRTARVPKDYTKGYYYDFEEGADFEITVHEEWQQEKEYYLR